MSDISKDMEYEKHLISKWKIDNNNTDNDNHTKILLQELK